MKFAKLLDDDGQPLRDGEVVEAQVSFNAREGIAQAFAPGQRAPIAEMVKARVVWMEAAGVRLEGMEPYVGEDGRQRYRAMEWQQIY